MTEPKQILTDPDCWNDRPDSEPLARIALALERIADALEDRVEPDDGQETEGLGELMLDGTRL